jgi:hypothetical protein
VSDKYLIKEDSKVNGEGIELGLISKMEERCKQGRDRESSNKKDDDNDD